jgi:hypothetical protein
MYPVSMRGSSGSQRRHENGGQGFCAPIMRCTAALLAALRQVAAQGGQLLQSSGTKSQSSSFLHAREGLGASAGRGGRAGGGGGVAVAGEGAGGVGAGGVAVDDAAGGGAVICGAGSADARGCGAGVSRQAARRTITGTR